MSKSNSDKWSNRIFWAALILITLFFLRTAQVAGTKYADYQAESLAQFQATNQVLVEKAVNELTAKAAAEIITLTDESNAKITENSEAVTGFLRRVLTFFLASNNSALGFITQTPEGQINWISDGVERLSGGDLYTLLAEGSPYVEPIEAGYRIVPPTAEGAYAKLYRVEFEGDVSGNPYMVRVLIPAGKVRQLMKPQDENATLPEMIQQLEQEIDAEK